MTAYSRILNEYEKRNSELKDNLALVETQIGHLLLSGRTDQVDNEYKQPYNVLIADIKFVNDSISSVEDNEQKLELLKKRVIEENNILTDVKSRCDSAFLNLGNYLYSNYSQSMAVIFGSAYTEASQEKHIIEELENKKKALVVEMEKQGVFTKIVTQVKLTPIIVNISAHQKKLNLVITEGARNAFDSKLVTAEIGGSAFEACETIRLNKETSEKQLASITQEINLLQDELKRKGSKKDLKLTLTGKTAELDKIALQAGHQFTKKYVTRDADILSNFPAEYKELLESVFNLRKELASLSRKTDIIQYTEQIDAANHTVDKMKDEILTNTERIEKLEKRNNELNRRVEDAISALDALKSRRSTLEIDEGVSVNRLLSDDISQVENKTETKDIEKTEK